MIVLYEELHFALVDFSSFVHYILSSKDREEVHLHD